MCRWRLGGDSAFYTVEMVSNCILQLLACTQKSCTVHSMDDGGIWPIIHRYQSPFTTIHSCIGTHYILRITTFFFRVDENSRVLLYSFCIYLACGYGSNILKLGTEGPTSSWCLDIFRTLSHPFLTVDRCAPSPTRRSLGFLQLGILRIGFENGVPLRFNRYIYIFNCYFYIDEFLDGVLI